MLINSLKYNNVRKCNQTISVKEYKTSISILHSSLKEKLV